MGLTKFDTSELLASAARYDAAAAHAAAARDTLGGIPLDPVALGSTASSSALGAALQAFHAQTAEAAAGHAGALAAFAQRLLGAGAAGDDGASATTRAAGG